MRDNPITRYWLANYADGHCTLCGNSGIIDSRGVRTPAGFPVGTHQLVHLSKWTGATQEERTHDRPTPKGKTMKLIQTSSGMIVAFGFDPVSRQKHIHRISWNDPLTQIWDPGPDNLAGFNDFMAVEINPEFIRECSHGTIVAYQPGLCIEMILIGKPLVWSFDFLRA